jgi:hypothetical protein
MVQKVQRKFYMNPNEQLYTVGLTKNYACTIIYCTKFQQLKCKDNYLPISTHGNVLNFCMHAHSIVSSLYKNFHN